MSDTEVDDLEDMAKYAPLIPIFGAVEAVFDAWERAVRDLELETEPAKWTKQLNRVQKRSLIHGRFDPKGQRSRIRRRLNKIRRVKEQKGSWR